MSPIVSKKIRRLTLKFRRHGQILIDPLIGSLPELDLVDQPTHFHGYIMRLVFYTIYMVMPV